MVKSNEHLLLNADVAELEEPDLCLAAMGFERWRDRPDPWSDERKSLRNFLHQLHSLKSVFSMASSWGASIYVFVRPDLRYLDSLGPFVRQAIQDRQEVLLYPNWQHHGGMNDRFAIASSSRIAEIYSSRGALIEDYFANVSGPFSGERLLKYVTLKSGIACRPIYARAERVRVGGQVKIESFRRPRTLVGKTTLRYFQGLLINRLSF